MLMWLQKQGCPWDQSTLREATKGKTAAHKDVLEWALLNGQWDAAALEEAGSRANSFGVYLWMLDHQDVLPQIKLCGRKCVGKAVNLDSEEALEQCTKEGFVLDETLWIKAVRCKSMRTVQWLKRKQIPCNPEQFFEMAWERKWGDGLHWVGCLRFPTTYWKLRSQ